MKIMFLTNLYPPNAIGGYERLCFDVAEAMVDRDHEIFVLTSSYGGKVAEYPGQVIDRSLFLFATDGDIYTPFSAPSEERQRRIYENLDYFKHAVENFQPDVLFVWNLFFFDSSLLDVIRRVPCKVVYLLTDNWLITFLNPLFMPAFFSKWVHNSPGLVVRIIAKARRLLTRWFQQANHLGGYAIFPSEFMRNLYLEAGVAVDNTTIVHHGVNMGLKNSLPREFKHFDGDHDPANLLFAGRVVEIKGVHTIIEALPEILAEMSPVPVKLTIIGDAQDDHYFARLKNRINELGMTSVVRFAPQVTPERLPEMFAAYDVYLFPSLYEPFSLTLIHALASGIPTVASDAGGNREIVFHRDTGLLHATGDTKGLAKCILKLLRNPELRRSVSIRGQHIGRKHTFKRMVNQIEEYLKL
jgi:glycosyltransferase involved in cell wall biosynthesis